MDAKLLERIKACDHLPSLPTIAVQVLDLAQKESVDIEEIARTLSKDPALCVKILRTVNSSFYGRSNEVSNISQALVIMGLQSVKTLVLSFSLVSSLFKGKSSNFSHLNYWRHSIYHATAARLIARKAKVVQQEEAFLIGLLADVGMVVLDQVLGEDYGNVLTDSKSHHDVAAAEMTALSTTHAEISGHMAASWKLPPLLSVPIGNHCTPATVADPQLQKLCAVAYVASRCADVFIDKDAGPAINDVRQSLTKLIGGTVAEADALLAEISSKVSETAALFEIKFGENQSFESVLRRANEMLVQIMLQSQQKETNLRQQNDALKLQVMTDTVTGLISRAGFEEQSAGLWATAEALKQSFSIIMIDLDKFKTINDTFGHPAGDDVLRAVGKVLKSSVRGDDVAARYGGEEFVLMLPQTTRDIAAMIADRVRSALHATPVISENVPIEISASFGVASYEPGGAMRTLLHVIKAADLALYHAKNTGRNRVKVFNPVAVRHAA